MISLLVGLFCITAFLFFIVSSLTKPQFIWATVSLNIVFLGILLFSYIQLIGTAIPMQFNIPIWKIQSFNKDNLVDIESYVIKDDLIHFLVKDKHGEIHYATFANTPAFLASLEAAINASRNGKQIQLSMTFTDTIYPDGSEGNFIEKDGLQLNLHEAKPEYKEATEQVDINGTGSKTPDSDKSQRYTGPNSN